MSREIRVQLELPQPIVEGLQDGSLKRIGGIIRTTDGTEQIVAHLREVGDLSKSALPSNILGTIGIGFQVLNLGVTVTGFLVIASRFRQLGLQLKEIENQLQILKALGEEVRGEERARRQAEFETALEEAARGERLGDRAVLNGARAAAYKSFRHYGHLLAEMIESGSAWDQPDRFEVLLSSAALAAVAVGRCDWQVEGSKAAQTSLAAAAGDLSDLVAALRRPLEDFGYRPKVLLGLLPIQRERLRAKLIASTECCSRLAGHVAEAEFADALGHDWASWQQLSPETASNDGVAVIVYSKYAPDSELSRLQPG